MSLQNPKIPSKSKRAEIADEAELFCISASKTVVFARLLVSVNDLHRGLSSPAFRVEQITQNQLSKVAFAGLPMKWERNDDGQIGFYQKSESRR
jgi:hypothetical protein